MIKRVSEKLAPGRTPAFTETHVVKAVEILGDEKPVGRMRLSKMLGLGEGETRTLVRHLRNERVVTVSKAGIILTKLGRRVLSDLRSKISEEMEIPESSLTIGPYNVAVLIKEAADRVGYGLEQRDAAIRMGALGATTLIFRDGRLMMPRVSYDVFRDIRPIRERLVAALKPTENDVIIIGSAGEKRTAEFAAKTAALRLLESRSG